VPFVVTTRKIFTVGLSIVYFRHETSLGQILAILLVLIVTVYEFLDNIRKGEKQPVKEIKEMDEEELIVVQEVEISEENELSRIRKL
jgi:hypothetical protein